MPAAYAHITLVNLLKEPHRLENIAGFPTNAIEAVLDYFKFTELGAVSPDYPYLVLGDKKSNHWADMMHYYKTGEIIIAGIKYLCNYSGERQKIGLSWLLGYASHVVADVTIHPVIQNIVGPYDGHKKEHRICEMNQDAYIFQKMNLDDIGISEHLDSGISACSEGKNLDHIIVKLWENILQKVHPEQYVVNLPKINKWHKGFIGIMDKFAEEGNRLIPFARHVAADIGLMYPSPDKIDKRFIRNLPLPNGGTADYDKIFERAIKNTGAVWKIISDGVFGNNTGYLAHIGNWNLDTGLGEDKKLVFWS